MANSVVIPQDIIDSIIAAVDNDFNSRLLKTCALVSSSFLLPSRKRLFSQIYLRVDNGQACQRLHQFLVENPVIQYFVRSLSINWNWDLKASQESSLTSILRLPFRCLKSFCLWPDSNWNDFSSELKDAILTIIHLPTLKTLHFNNLRNMPITLLQGIHLTKLKLSSISPLFDLDGKQSKLALAVSEGVANTASHTVIDQCEWVFFQAAPESLPEPIFLPFMSHLHVFEIYVNPPSAKIRDLDILSFMIRSLRVSLSSPATLEHIKLRILFEGYSNRFNCDAFFDRLRVADVWRHLDSFITYPSGSWLQRVDVVIKYFYYDDDDVIDPDETEVMERILDALPLLREKGILFVEATNTSYGLDGEEDGLA